MERYLQPTIVSGVKVASVVGVLIALAIRDFLFALQATAWPDQFHIPVTVFLLGSRMPAIKMKGKKKASPPYYSFITAGSLGSKLCCGWCRKSITNPH